MVLKKTVEQCEEFTEEGEDLVMAVVIHDKGYTVKLPQDFTEYLAQSPDGATLLDSLSVCLNEVIGTLRKQVIRPN